MYVFDLTRKGTFEDTLNWKNEIEKVINNYSSVLVGNKLDLISKDNKKIQKKESEDIKKKLNACAFYETSAKIDTGVQEFFLKLVSHIYKRS